MKKVLSIMLAAMMLVSLFAMNVSAAIPSKYEVLEGYVPDTNLIVQDFSDATVTDYTAYAYDGARKVGEDGILHMFGAYRSGVASYTYSDTPITTGEFTYEFDFMRNDDMSTDVLLSVIFQREANANSENANLKKYGVVIPVRTVGMVTVDGVNYEDATNPMVDIEPHKWYKFRLVIDEAAFIAAGGTEKTAAELNALMQVYRKAEDETEWKRLTHYANNHFDSSVCRVYGSKMNSLGITDKEVILGVGVDNNGEKCDVTGFVWDEAKQAYVSAGTEYIKRDDFTKADFQVDNIRIYEPGNAGEVVSYDYPINKGVVYTRLDSDSRTMGSKEVEIKNENGEVTGTEIVASGTTYLPDFKIGWESEPKSFITTFDAMTEVTGGPLSFSVAGIAAKPVMYTIAATEEGKWYNYKILCTSDGTAVSDAGVYRKAAEETEWTKLTSGVEYWNGYNSSESSFDKIRFYLYAGLTGGKAASNCAPGTKWCWKNLQVTDSYAMTGTATVADGELTIDLNTVVAGATAMIAAVYDGDRMVSANAVDVAAFANEAEIVVPYDAEITAPAVKIFVLNGMGTMVPMDIPVVITGAIQ